MWPGREVALGCSMASNVTLMSGKCLVNNKVNEIIINSKCAVGYEYQ